MGMRTTQEIVERVQQLERELVWDTGVNDEAVRTLLSSVVTGRVMAVVDNCRVTGVRYSGSNEGTQFVTTHLAKEWAKYTVIADVLADELRQVRQ